MKNRVGWIFLLTLSVAIGVLAPLRVTRQNHPNLLHWEVSGIAYDLPFEHLCSPNPVAGFEHGTENATEQRYSSVFYSAPTKLLYGTFDPFSAHRLISCLLYALMCLFLALAFLVLRMDSALAAFGLVYFGLHPMVVSHLFQAKLSLTCFTWLALCLLILALDLRQPSGAAPKSAKTKKFLGWISLAAPLLTVSAYECYTGLRPVALTFAAFSALYLFIRRRRQLITFAIMFVPALTLLRALHPTMRFDLSIFSGRSEGPFNGGGRAAFDFFKVIPDRLRETIGYLSWPVEGRFDSEHIGGHLDMIVAVAVGIVILCLCLRRTTVATAVRNRGWLLLWLAGLLLVSFLIPLLSNTPVRAHRQFGIYFGAAVLMLLIYDALTKFSSWSRRGIETIAVAAALALLLIRIPALMAFEEPANRNAPDFLANLQQLKDAQLPLDFPADTWLRICDTASRPHQYTGWHSLLYGSGYACRAKIRGEILSCKPGPQPEAILIERSNNAPLRITYPAAPEGAGALPQTAAEPGKFRENTS